MNIAVMLNESDLIAIDPRPCANCGLLITRHRMVDDGDGPEFFCDDVAIDELTLDELERRAELRREEEIAGIIARIDAAYIQRPPPPDKPNPYCTPQSTVDAFRYVARQGDPAMLVAWLADHPLDAHGLLARSNL